MNDLTQVRLAAAAAGDNMQRVVDLMIDGVAFPHHVDRRVYNVFSHEGDDLGTLTTAEVNFAIHHMKSLGRRVGTMAMDDPCHPGYSFAWAGPHSLDVQQRS